MQARRIQEPAEEKEACLEQAKARWMEETPQEKDVHLEKAHKKRDTEIQQKNLEQKDLLKMSNNGLSLALSINQLNSQLRKRGRSLNHR